MKRRRHSLRGTTIIEVATAVVILSIALPAMITAFADSARQTVFPSQSAVASYLAIERMEEIIARRYRSSDGYAAVTTANFPAESPVNGFSIFNRAVTVEFVNAALATVGSDQGYKKVTVTVTWDSGARRIGVERIFADF
jgi:Tfp pilus assembly protein PilV